MTSIHTHATFPVRPSEISSEWLTSTLRNAAVIGEDTTISTWTTSDIGVGGMIGDIVRLVPDEVNGGHAPAVIAKFSTQNSENRAVAAAFAMYKREYKFYRELAHLFPDVSPLCYYAGYDAETEGLVLLFEDLSEYRTGDQTVGISLEDARTAVRAVSQLHAKTWNADKDTAYDEWPRVNGPIYLQGFANGVAAGLEPAMKAFGHVVPPEVMAATDRIREAIPSIHQQMAEGPQALVHGDFRVDNFMFGKTQDHRPFVMLDFQGPIVTKAIHDVAYLLTQSLPSDVRRQHERSLVDDYHRSLVERGVTGYDSDACWQDYRLAALHCFEFAVVVAGTLDPSNERAKLWIGEIMRRSSQAIVDLELLNLLP